MDLRDELRASAREVLAAGSDWSRIVDAGWTGLEIAEELGGAGVTFAETAVVLEELGRAAADTRYLGVALAVGALTTLTSNTSRDLLLQRVAAGSTAALAAGFTVVDGAVTGRADFAADAADADIVLLVADDSVVIAEDLAVAAQPVLDETRHLATVSADAATVVQSWPLSGAADRLVERAAVAVACDSLGVAEAMLAATVDYVKVRRQFDRPIGSFQAVKHACADMLVRTRVARQLVDAAVADVTAGVDASVSAAMAKSYACAAAVEVAGKAMQLHGGIGYTWESGVHVYLKRAALNRSLFGTPIAHRRLVAMRYG